MVTRQCVICGKPFDCYPSANNVTCSRDCRRERQRRQLLKSPVVWSDEARRRQSARGQTPNLQQGTAAAQKSPLAGRYETHKDAKVWMLIDPDGNQIAVRNLLNWARDHTAEFGKPPGDRSAAQIAGGFRAIALTMAGKRGPGCKQRGATTYLGWTLKGPPQAPEYREIDKEVYNPMARYQITYTKGNAPLVAWADTLEAAQVKADQLRRVGYAVMVWEHTKAGARKADI